MKRTDAFIRQLLLSRSRVDKTTPLCRGKHCRRWLRATRNHYGVLWDGESVQYTHRLAFVVFIGPIPPGLDVLHHCDHPWCIEPAHLWSGTHQDNMVDRDRKGRWRGGAIKGRPSKQRGMGHALSKLNEEQARFVLLSARTNVDLAREFGVSEGLIRGIRAGRNWGWLQKDTP